jgi:Transglycosylase SLT domain
MASPAIGVVITGKSDLDAVFAKTSKQLDAFRKQSEVTTRQIDKMTATKGITDLTKGFQSASIASFDFLKNITRSVDSLGLLTGAGSIAGLTALSGKIATFGQSQLNASRGINMNVKSLSTWQNAAVAAGSTADDATSSISGLEKAVTDMKFKNSPANGGAAQILGNGWQQKYKSDADILIGISTKLQGLHGANKASNMQLAETTFGLSQGFTQDFLGRGPAYVRQQLALASKHSMDDGQADKLDKLANGFSLLGSSMKEAGVAAAASIAPKLTPALDGLSTWIDAHQKAVGDFVGVVTALGVGLTALKVGKMVLPKITIPRADIGGCGCGGGLPGNMPGGKPGSGLHNLLLLGPGGIAWEVLTNGIPDIPDTPGLKRQFPGLSGGSGPDRGPGWWQQNLGINFQNSIRGLEGKTGVLFPDIEAEVRKDAKAAGIDPDRAVAQFRVEGGGYNKVSPAGAFGPSQLMPGTAAMLGVPTSVDDPNYDWRQNVAAGIRYQKMMQQQFGNQDAALGAYNWGPDAMKRWNGDPSTMPAETQKYIATIDGLTGSATMPASKEPADGGLSATAGAIAAAAALHAGEYRSAITGKWESSDSDANKNGEVHLYIHPSEGTKVRTRQRGAVQAKTGTAMPDSFSTGWR